MAEQVSKAPTAENKPFTLDVPLIINHKDKANWKKQWDIATDATGATKYDKGRIGWVNDEHAMFVGDGISNFSDLAKIPSCVTLPGFYKQTDGTYIEINPNALPSEMPEAEKSKYSVANRNGVFLILYDNRGTV